jgi:uncharacterized protein YprB with RNaseH-like and TPR domain
LSDLYSRIQSIKKAKAQKSRSASGANAAETRGGSPSASSGKTEEREPEAFLGLGDWTEVAPDVFERETLDESVRAPGLLLRSALLEREVDCSSVCFMDTETTGLSGGAGTTVFLVGAGTLGPDGMRVRQVLLGDYPAEPEFLARVEQALGHQYWASYNGRAFDAKLLESRFLMNGCPPMAPEHLDLLYWSRRLWRSRLPACNLGTIESSILGRPRDDDIPGIEIPDRFFQFAATRDAGHLSDVFEHHRLDIVSLGHLFLRLEEVLADPGADRSVDRYQLGRWLLLRGDLRGMNLLEALLRDRAEEADSGRRRRELASVLASRYYRRTGRPETARSLLEELRALEPTSREIMSELAKVCEHDLRDPGAALGVVVSYLESTGAEPDAEIERRMARLERKIERQTDVQ